MEHDEVLFAPEERASSVGDVLASSELSKQYGLSSPQPKHTPNTRLYKQAVLSGLIAASFIIILAIILILLIK